MWNCAPFTLRLLACSLVTNVALSQDWPQWRGPQRDGRATGFQAPAAWPAELTKGWSVVVGDGVASPALFGERLYAYARVDGDEVLRCLNAADGATLWEDRAPAAEIQGAAGGFPGPRCSPSVSDGKVVVLGVEGTLRCLDAATGELLWKNTSLAGSVPRFATSSSPIVMDGLCIAQLGGQRDGGVYAFDLGSGEERWKWTGDGPAYGSPIAMNIDGTQIVVLPTDRNLVALSMTGEALWEVPYTQGRYNSATPICDGQTLFIAGPERGMSALKFQRAGTALAADRGWSNPELSVAFNTPVLRDGLLFGLSGQNQLFCADSASGDMLWSAPISGETPPAAAPRDQDRPQEQNPGQRGGRRRGRRGGGGGRGGYGSIVDAGAAMLSLTPDGNLVVFEPARDQFHELARYKVAERGTYAYPVAVDRRLFIKDQDALTLWTVE